MFYEGARTGGRAVDSGGPSVYKGGPKFEIKHKSRCLQKSKLRNWGGVSMLIVGARHSLAPALEGAELRLGGLILRGLPTFLYTRFYRE